MKIGFVVGQVTATRKDERLVGGKLLLVRQLNRDNQPEGEETVAVDTVGAGVGETVLLVSGSVASGSMPGVDFAPVDAAIVGIIDNIGRNETY